MTVIINEASGAAAADNRRVVQDAFGRARLVPRILSVKGADIVAAAKRAADAGDMLVAAGGDGTVSAVASVAVAAAATFGVIPLGTLNHFARDVGIPLDVDKAVATIAAASTRLLDVGDLNGRTFLNNVSLGIYPRLVWERQMEQRRGHGKRMAFAIGLMKTWVGYRTLTVQMNIDGVDRVRRTPFVFVGNGDYQAEGLGLGTRSSLDGGRLSVYVAPEIGRFEMLALPVRALAGRLTPDVKFEAFRAGEVSVEPTSDEAGVGIDGELLVVRSPLRCTIRRQALRTIVPEPS